MGWGAGWRELHTPKQKFVQLKNFSFEVVISCTCKIVKYMLPYPLLKPALPLNGNLKAPAHSSASRYQVCGLDHLSMVLATPSPISLLSRLPVHFPLNSPHPEDSFA